MSLMVKAFNSGTLYGISWFGLYENLDINPKEASKFIDKCYETYPVLKNIKKKVLNKFI